MLYYSGLLFSPPPLSLFVLPLSVKCSLCLRPCVTSHSPLRCFPNLWSRSWPACRGPSPFYLHSYQEPHWDSDLWLLSTTTTRSLTNPQGPLDPHTINLRNHTSSHCSFSLLDTWPLTSVCWHMIRGPPGRGAQHTVSNHFILMDVESQCSNLFCKKVLLDWFCVCMFKLRPLLFQWFDSLFLL